MLNQVRDYLTALTGLLVMLGIYQATVTKFLTPPEPIRAEIAVREFVSDDETIADLFPETAWQRGRAIRLKTDDGMLLYQNMKQRDKQTYELSPITIVIGRGVSTDQSKAPILIEAAEGAIIEFDGPLDLMSGLAPSIRRGQMRGKVHIERVGGSPTNKIASSAQSSVYRIAEQDSAQQDASRTLDIHTSNVWIDRRRIWTPDAISMLVGRAKMIGRDLTLHLTASASGSAGRARSGNVAGALDRMELIYLDQLTLPLGDATKPETQGTIDVRCGGRIEYDFALDQLHLDRDVKLMRLMPGGNDWLDRFECQSLKMTLRDPLNGDIARTTGLDWIDRIEASGNPLKANLREQDIALEASRIVFDPIEGTLVAEPAQASGAVQVRRGMMTAFLSRLLYQFDPKSPQTLGVIEIDRGGVVRDDSLVGTMKEVTWSRLLRVEPLGAATTDNPLVDYGVLCEGGIQGKLSDGGTFHADHVEGVLKPTGADSLNQRLMPDRFAITGNVRVASQTLNAQTEQMDLFFVQSDKPVQPPVTAPSPVSVPQGSVRQWVADPSENASAVDPQTMAQSKPLTQPATLRGDRVTAQLTVAGGGLTASDLSVVGNVVVTHTLLLRQGSDPAPIHVPAVLTGDQLRIRDGDGGDVLQLTGATPEPAKLAIGDGYFIGTPIQIRPDDNYVWIPSPGEFVAPTEMLPPLASPNPNYDPRFDPPPSRWLRAPRCRFGESLSFDGQTATLVGGVDLDAAMTNAEGETDISLRGDEMQLTLASNVQLNAPETLRTATIQRIALYQTSDRPIDLLLDRFVGQDVHDSRHHLQTSRLEWIPTPVADGATNNDRSTLGGQIIAPGPGSYRAWLKKLPGSETDDATDETSVKNNAADLTGIHLVYNGSMQGDLVAQTLSFHQSVRVARRMLPDFQHAFDATQMDRLSDGEMTLDCQRLTLSVDPASRRLSSVDPAWEMEAVEGVVIRTRNPEGGYEMTADRCGYTSGKDLLLIQGAPSRPARLNQTNALGQPGMKLALRHATFRLRTMELISSQIESFQMGPLPNQDRTKPK